VENTAALSFTPDCFMAVTERTAEMADRLDEGETP
jgi:hypothetical protein